jgi:hypothetical protein
MAPLSLRLVIEKKILTEETIDRCLGCMAGWDTNSRTRELTPQERSKNMGYLLGRKADSDIRYLARPICYGAVNLEIFAPPCHYTKE